MSVAAQGDEERDEEPCEGPCETVLQVTLYVLGIGSIEAFFSPCWKMFGIEHVWKTLNSYQHPSGDRDEHRVGDSDSSHHSHWVDDRQVPVHTNTRQEPDTSIQVQVEAESCYLAEGVSKNPPAAHEVVHHQKRKRKEVQKIRNSQVEQKHTDVPHFLPLLQERLQPPAISHQTDDEHQDVNRRQESAREAKVDTST